MMKTTCPDTRRDKTKLCSKNKSFQLNHGGFQLADDHRSVILKEELQGLRRVDSELCLSAFVVLYDLKCIFLSA